jgi:hypothetical protein
MMITTHTPNQDPQSAGEHEAWSLMNVALDCSKCAVIDYPVYVENYQNIPYSCTFMVGGVSEGSFKQEVRLRGFVLPDGTLELLIIGYGSSIHSMKRRIEPGKSYDDTEFMKPDIWKTTVKLLFGERK